MSESSSSYKKSRISGSITILERPTPVLEDLYTLGKTLGQGKFGTTRLCTEVATKKEYACKSISKLNLQSLEDVEDVRNQIKALSLISGNSYIVAIKEVYEDQNTVHIVMELCNGGDLFDQIVQRGYFSERKAATILRKIVDVVVACHLNGIIHRNLKPENFLIHDKNDDCSLKVIGFGSCALFQSGQIFTDVVGSSYYMAPEVICKKYGPEVDVWTCGIILYILLSGVPPFWADTHEGIFDAILRGELDLMSEPWKVISESAKDLVRKMLVREPSERISAMQVLSHPWICGGETPDGELDPVVFSRLKQFSAMNKLKNIVLRVITKSLSVEEIERRKKLFKMFDKDDSGSIDIEELKEGCRNQGSNLNETDFHDLMEAADVDNNGTLDFEEFIYATKHLNQVERKEDYEKAFSYFDKDGNGYITLDEFKTVCEEYHVISDIVVDAFKEADTNNDNRIDLEEFVGLMLMRDHGNSPTGSNKRVTQTCMTKCTGLLDTIKQKGYVGVACMGPSGLLYTACGKEISVWEEGRKLVVLKSSLMVKSVCEQTGKVFAGHEDGSIKMWRMSSTNPISFKQVGFVSLKSYMPKFIPLRAKENRDKTISCLCLNHDMSLLYAGSRDHRIRVYKVDLSVCVDIMEAHTSFITSLVTGPGEILFSSSGDGFIKLWKRRNDRDNVRHYVMKTMALGECGVNVLEMSTGNTDIANSSRYLFAGLTDGTIKFWKESVGWESQANTIYAHNQPISCMSSRRNGRILFTGSSDNTIRVWRRGGDDLYISLWKLGDHVQPVKCLAVTNDVEDTTQHRSWVLYSGGFDKCLKISWIVDPEEGMSA